MDKAVSNIMAKMKQELLAKPLMFSEVLDLFVEESYRDILLAWSQLREDGLLSRTVEGLYFIQK